LAEPKKSIVISPTTTFDWHGGSGEGGGGGPGGGGGGPGGGGGGGPGLGGVHLQLSPLYWQQQRHQHSVPSSLPQAAPLWVQLQSQ